MICWFQLLGSKLKKLQAPNQHRETPPWHLRYARADRGISLGGPGAATALAKQSLSSERLQGARAGGQGAVARAVGRAQGVLVLTTEARSWVGKLTRMTICGQSMHPTFIPQGFL